MKATKEKAVGVGLGTMLPVVLAFLVAGLVYGFILGKGSAENASAVQAPSSELVLPMSTYRVIQGYDEAFGSYNLRSFDKGKNWYAFQETPDGEVKILGPVEEIYPGLWERITVRLVEHVDRLGSSPRA